MIRVWVSAGRQLFESDSTLANSDAVFGDEGDVVVDFSKYERREDDDEEEEVEERLRLANLSDEE